MILSINGLYGSGGNEIGEILAKELGYTIWDKEIVKQVEAETNLDLEGAVKDFYQEEESKTNEFYKALFQLQTDVIPVGIKEKKYLAGKKISGLFSNFMDGAPLAHNKANAAYAQLEVDVLKNKLEEQVKKAAEKDNQIFFGHCTSYFLKDDKNVLKIFTKACPASCRKHIQAAYDIKGDEVELGKLIRRTNMRRAYYYETFTGGDWENAQAYDICIDVDLLGVEGTAKLLAQLVKSKQ